MLMYRRGYINRYNYDKNINEQIAPTEESVDKSEKPITDLSIYLEKTKKDLADSFSSLNKNINDLKQMIKYMVEKLDNMELYQEQIANNIDIDSSNSTNFCNSNNVNSDSVNSAIEKTQNDYTQINQVSNDYVNTPVMPGSGFAHITPQYLKTLNKG